MYFILIGGVVLFLLMGIRYTGDDVFNPANFLLLFTLFALLLALNLFDFWDLANYGEKATNIMLIGLGAFFIGALSVSQPNQHKIACYSHGIDGTINIGKSKRYFLLFVALLASFVFYLYFRSHVSSVGMIAEYKEYRNSGDAEMPAYINLLLKYLQTLAYFDVFILINNSLYGKFKESLSYLAAPLLFVFVSILSANRGNILEMLMGASACWYILYLKIRGFSKSMIKKVLKYGVVGLLVVLSLFFLSVVYLLNSEKDWSDTNPVTYVTFYVSGSIASLDVYFKQGGLPCRWWGEETFVTLNNNLSSLFGLSRRSQRFLEFREAINFSAVNIYTSFRRFYHDFGYFGVCFLSFLQGWISAKYYKYILKRKGQIHVDLPLCIYCCFFYTIPYTLTDELFYSSLVSISGIYRLSIIVFLYKYYFSNTRNSKL